MTPTDLEILQATREMWGFQARQMFVKDYFEKDRFLNLFDFVYLRIFPLENDLMLSSKLSEFARQVGSLWDMNQ